MTVAPTREWEVHTLDGRRLRAGEAGDPAGPLVLVHHGTPSRGLIAAQWAADAEARGIRLVGYDRPGYGDSDAQPGRTVSNAAADCAAIADSLGVDRFRTWGISGGGPHALACAALLPERVVAAAAVASVAPYGVPGLDWIAGMGQDNVDEFGAALKGEEALREYLVPAREETLAGADRMAEVWASLLPPVDADVLRGEMGDFIPELVVAGLTSGITGWLEDDLAFVRDWGFDPAAITRPVLVVQGGRDLMVPAAHGDWLAARIPEADAWRDPEQGHLSLYLTVSAVHEWLLAC